MSQQLAFLDQVVMELQSPCHPTERSYDLNHPMSDPIIAQKSPCPVNVEAGKTYYWCSCGASKSQPFCDGSHKGTGFSPVPYQAEKDGVVYFCGCKNSSKGALCDGTHSKL